MGVLITGHDHPRRDDRHRCAPRCGDCGLIPCLDAYESRAGFYIGTFCGCGAYSRESGYYPTLEAAAAAFGRGYSR